MRLDIGRDADALRLPGLEHCGFKRALEVAVRRCRGKGKALRLEYAIKQLTRVDKEALVADPVRIATLARRV